MQTEAREKTSSNEKNHHTNTCSSPIKANQFSATGSKKDMEIESSPTKTQLFIETLDRKNTDNFCEKN